MVYILINVTKGIRYLAPSMITLTDVSSSDTKGLYCSCVDASNFERIDVRYSFQLLLRHQAHDLGRVSETGRSPWVAA